MSRLLCLVLITALGFAAPGLQAGEEPRVIIQDYKFIPQHIEIRLGDTLVWENREKRQYHSIWFESLDAEEPDYIFPEETWERKFDQAGTFNYRCGPHPEMTGTVTVVE